MVGEFDPAAGAGVWPGHRGRKYGIFEPTFYIWKTKYAGMTVSDARRPKELESENAKLKKLLAESELDKVAL
jgi:putative transposase